MILVHLFTGKLQNIFNLKDTTNFVFERSVLGMSQTEYIDWLINFECWLYRIWELLIAFSTTSMTLHHKVWLYSFLAAGWRCAHVLFEVSAASLWIGRTRPETRTLHKQIQGTVSLAAHDLLFFFYNFVMGVVTAKYLLPCHYLFGWLAKLLEDSFPTCLPVLSITS